MAGATYERVILSNLFIYLEFERIFAFPFTTVYWLEQFCYYFLGCKCCICSLFHSWDLMKFKVKKFMCYLVLMYVIVDKFLVNMLCSFS